MYDVPTDQAFRTQQKKYMHGPVLENKTGSQAKHKDTER